MKKVIILLALAALVLSPAISGTRLLAQEDADIPADNGTTDNEEDNNGNGTAEEQSGDDENDLDVEGETIDESDLNEVDPWLLETDPPNTKPKE